MSRSTIDTSLVLYYMSIDKSSPCKGHPHPYIVAWSSWSTKGSLNYFLIIKQPLYFNLPKAKSFVSDT